MNLKNLENKVILITGSAKRIGREIALFLAQYSPKLILHYNTSYKEISEVLDIVHHYNKDSYSIQCNFLDERQVHQFFKKVQEEKVDILINSASIFPKYDQWELFDPHIANQIFNVNVIIPLMLIKNCFNNTQSGIVINFIDASVERNFFDHFVYRLSKVSLLHATKILAKKLAPNVRVNGISPGAILPPAQLNKDNIIEEDLNQNEFYQRKLNSIPLKIAGDPLYILQAVQFIIENDFLTGCIISIDGGEFL